MQEIIRRCALSHWLGWLHSLSLPSKDLSLSMAYIRLGLCGDPSRSICCKVGLLREDAVIREFSDVSSVKPMLALSFLGVISDLWFYKCCPSCVVSSDSPLRCSEPPHTIPGMSPRYARRFLRIPCQMCGDTASIRLVSRA